MGSGSIQRPSGTRSGEHDSFVIEPQPLVNATELTDRGVPRRLDLAGRLALRPKEAAEALGLSERTLRRLLPEIPHVRRDGVLLFPVEPLRRWLEDEARAERRRADRVAQEIVDSLSK